MHSLVCEYVSTYLYLFNWKETKYSICDQLIKNAGPPDTGIFSPSVQNTLYIAQKEVLERVPQMGLIEVELPNKHYVPVDFSKFSKITGAQNDEGLVYY